MGLEWHEAQEIAHELVNNDADRDALYQDITDAVNLDWRAAPTEDWIRATISPHPHTATKRLADLLLSAEPDIDIPTPTDDARAQEIAKKTETILRLVVKAASDVRQARVERDAALSAARYALVCLKVANTAEMVEGLGLARKKRGGSKETPAQRRYSELARRAPFLIDVLNPMNVHYLGGVHGVDCVVEKSERTVSSIRAVWGADLLEGMKRSDTVDFFEYWDHECTFVWCEGEGKTDAPIYEAEHDRGFSPYVVTPAGDSPMLYAAIRGGIWQQQNLALTAKTSAALNLAFPSLVLEAVNPAEYDDMAIDATQPGQLIKLRQGDKLYNPLDRVGTSEALDQLLTISNQLMEQSTLSRVVFGDAPENVSAYSAINTLLQGARVPLSPVQDGVSRALSALCELILRWIAYSEQPISMVSGGQVLTLSPDEINPDQIEVSVELKPKFPTDQMQIANMVTMLRKEPLISRVRALEMLGESAPQDELDRVVGDMVDNALLQSKVQQVVMAAQQAEAQAFGVPGAPAGPVTPEQMQAEMMAQQAPPMEANLPPGMQPQALGVPPEAQMAAIQRGGGPPIA